MKIRKHLSLFELLLEATDEQRLALLKTLNRTQLQAVLEAIYNVLRGTCPIEDKLKKTLYPHRGVFRRLVSKNITRQQQQRLLVKHRSVVALALKPVVDLLSEQF